MIQKDLVVPDFENLKDLTVIKDNFVLIEDGIIRHNALKVAIDLFSYLME